MQAIGIDVGGSGCRLAVVDAQIKDAHL